jgi:hypothetical protein
MKLLQYELSYFLHFIQVTSFEQSFSSCCILFFLLIYLRTVLTSLLLCNNVHLFRILWYDFPCWCT